MKIVADRNIPHVQACFSHLGEVTLFDGREINSDSLAEADVLLVRSVTKVHEDLLARSPVKFVATATIGIEHIDVSYLKSRGIGFASAPGSNAMSVADWVTAALLTMAEKHSITLADRSIGIVGVGNVGSRVARKCRALGMQVVLNDPPLARQTGDGQFRPLTEVYNCDFVTLHTPLTREGDDPTFHLANQAFFAELKPGAVFLNSSRGGVHDTEALLRAMRNDHLQAVALDVWENEPNINSVLQQEVDIATPHIAGYSLDGKIAGLLMIYQAVCDFFGLQSEHRASDFLPEPTVKEIKLESSPASDQDQIHGTVQQVYSIDEDDARCREMLSAPEPERRAFFDRLRKTYPVRREFQNTCVLGLEKTCGLARRLEGIGFRVV